VLSFRRTPPRSDPLAPNAYHSAEDGLSYSLLTCPACGDVVGVAIVGTSAVARAREGKDSCGEVWLLAAV